MDTSSDRLSHRCILGILLPFTIASIVLDPQMGSHSRDRSYVIHSIFLVDTGSMGDEETWEKFGYMDWRLTVGKWELERNQIDPGRTIKP
jgi:hypothetical protein